MELLSPAGNLEKLRVAYDYGADAAYIGISNFSLRAKAENFDPEQGHRLEEIKGRKKLYGALNIYFHQSDLLELERTLESLSGYPFDALIVADIGIVPLLKNYLPGMDLHLSTQANCTNSEAAKLYRDMGFKRIVPAREMSLREIEAMRRQADVELEVFVHGAMCVAYSGRCLLSGWMADRSGNRGHCAHSCRWEYRVLEERERPGEYYPVVEGENFSTILSSRDICMFDHLEQLRDAGVDAVKIEGRMKSSYYVGVTTRSYRRAIDALHGDATVDIAGHRAELTNVSHRELSTGFYFGPEQMNRPTLAGYQRSHRFLGIVGPQLTPGAQGGTYDLDIKNTIVSGCEIEFLTFDGLAIKDDKFELLDHAGQPVAQAHHDSGIRLKTKKAVRPGFLIRGPLDQPEG